MAAGHMLPMLDLARLFSHRGFRCTILTTPPNAHKVNSGRSTPINNYGHAEFELQIVDFPKVPTSESTLNKHDDLSSITTLSDQFKFLVSLNLLRDPVAEALVLVRPDAIVSDMFFPWTTGLAAELGIPRLVFQGGCAFSSCALHSFHSLRIANPHWSDTDISPVVLPGLPHSIELLPAQISSNYPISQDFAAMLRDISEAETSSHGVIINSFYELEPDYADHYRRVIGRRTWHVGPVSFCRNNPTDRRRERTLSADHRELFHWLDTKVTGPVLYISFGSLAYVGSDQLMEITLSLESSRRPFIWVVRHAVDASGQEWLDRAMASGLGLVVRYWVPQVEVLDHDSVGGFMTHCGWNSSLESIAAGVPMATWPLFAKQFYNEKLIVGVLGVGVSVGSKHFTLRLEGEAVLPAAQISVAVDELMGAGESAQDRRRRVRDLAIAATKALEEGGSSYEDMTRLISGLRCIES